MKIIEIIPSLESGGAERFVIDLCNEISKSHIVTLVVLYSINDKNQSFYLSELSKRVKIVTLNKHKSLDLKIFYKLLKLVKRLKPDVVHTHMSGILYIQLSLLLNKSPLYIHTVHNDAFKEQGRDFLNRYSRINSFRRNLVVPVTISNESQDSFEKCYNISAPMIFNGRNVPSIIRISNEVKSDFLKYKQDDKTIVVINLARIQHQKRQDMLARVAKRLEKEGFDFSILVIGRVNNIQMAESIKETNAKKLFLLGEKSNPLEYLSVADAYTLSSSYEGMPISLIEALGVGCIPVCTPVGGCKDIIQNGVNGLLSKDISEEAYYEILKTFLSTNQEEKTKMREAAQESYKQLSMTECSKQYISLFESHLNK